LKKIRLALIAIIPLSQGALASSIEDNHRFGMGLSYQAAEIDVSHEDSNGSEKIDIELCGPCLYLTYGF
jgi:hypothetical protein